MFRYIMTSEFTLKPTQTFFQENSHFGLEPSDVIMFEQRMIPAVSFDGKVILERKGKIAMAPGRFRSGNANRNDSNSSNWISVLQTVMEVCTRRWWTTTCWRTWNGEGWSTSTFTVWTTSWWRWPTQFLLDSVWRKEPTVEPRWLVGLFSGFMVYSPLKKKNLISKHHISQMGSERATFFLL